MTALGMVSSDDRCSAPPGALYTECPGNHQHAFSDPAREGAMLAGWATLHEPVVEMVARINDWWSSYTPE